MRLNKLFLLLLCCSGIVHAENGVLVSQYDKQQDTISIKAENVSVLEVFKRIGLHTGIEVFADQTIDQKISYNVVNTSLEKAIKQLSRGLNTAIFYQNTDTKRIVISQIRLLPKGVEDTSRAKPLIKIENAAVAYGQQKGSAEIIDPIANQKIDSSNFDYMESRWLSRVSKLPLEDRARVENIIREQQERRDAFRARMAKEQEAAIKAREERHRQIQAFEDRLKEQSPELYEAYLQEVEKKQKEIISKQD